MRGAARALKYPNYRLFFMGQAVSVLGTWLQNVGLSWLVYRLTGSALLLGTIQFAMLAPSLLLSPFAGVWVDRMDRKKLLIATQALSMLQAAILAALVLTNSAQIWHLVLLAIGLGIVSAFDAPGRQTLVAEIIEDRNVLPNAIALNSFLFNLARLVGPAIAGVIIHEVGEGVCFALNAASYAPVIFAINLIKVVRPEAEPRHRNIIEDLREGWQHVTRYVPVRAILSLLAVMSMIGGSYSVLMPIFADEVFHGNAQTLGILYSAVGVGAVAAGLYLASRGSVIGLGNFVGVSAIAFSVGLISFGLNSAYLSALPILAVIGFGAMGNMAASNTVVQTLTDDRLRGRVMAFFMMAFAGAMPLGSFASGVAADLIGPRWTVSIAGAVGLIAALGFRRVLPAAREAARPMLVEKGILAEAMPGDASSREAADVAQRPVVDLR